MTSDPSTPRARFLSLLRTAADDGSLLKLTLGKYRGSDATVRNLFIRPVELKAGRQLSLLWRHATRDITKNLPVPEALERVAALLGHDFLDAHLFTTASNAQFETGSDGQARLRVKAVSGAAAPGQAAAQHDRAKSHLIPADAPWLRSLGVTNDRARPREGMADKFRQIQKFAEMLGHLMAEAFPGLAFGPPDPTPPAPPASAPATDGKPIRVVDMGCGKGYLTFGVATLLGARATVEGIEARPELVAQCNRIATEHGLAERLRFSAGAIAETPIGHMDVLIALHACDTATDDALAKGIEAGARLLVVAPCCQKELRVQITAAPVLAPALRHGIFQERHAEFATDALRALLLEWAGYSTKVFEFISTEHTPKNLMIAAIKSGPVGDPTRAEAVRELAAFYGIRTQHLARNLGFALRQS